MMARWTSTPPAAPPVSRKRMFTSTQHHDPATAMLGPSAPVANPDSLSDPDAAAEHLLQHWYQVRHVFTKLRADGPTDRCSIPVALDRLADAFPLVARSALRAVMEEATAGSETVNYDAFMSAVRKWAGPGDNVGSQREASRFAAKGIMDKRMQKVLRQAETTVPLGTRRPDHALGHSALNCPYGIEGDAERMEAIFHTYMDRRVDSIQKFFVDMDSNHDGKLSYSEFESAMLRMDPDTPRPAVSALIRALDEGHKGFITLNDIRSNFTVEFMKSKAHRNSPGHRNILAWPNETQEQEAGVHAPRPPDSTKRASGARRPQPKLAPVNTKSQVLRLEAIRETLRESDPLRAEKMRQQGNLKEAKPLRSQLKHDGIVGFHGRPV